MHIRCEYVYKLCNCALYKMLLGFAFVCLWETDTFSTIALQTEDTDFPPPFFPRFER